MYYEQLGRFLVGNHSLSDEDVQDEVMEQFGILPSDFRALIDALLDSIHLGVDTNGKPSIGFSDGKQWFASKEIESQFLFAIVRYLTAGDKIPEGKGFARIVHFQGKKAYQIIITGADDEPR